MFISVFIFFHNGDILEYISLPETLFMHLLNKCLLIPERQLSALDVSYETLV